MSKLTKEEFINRSRIIHGDKYDYSKVEYVNNSTKVCIICPEHGEFWQVPNSHLNGNGCPACSGLKRLTKEEFVKRANEIHSHKYDYSQSDFVSTHKKVDIICPIHGTFSQTPKNHLRGQGCPKCGKKYTQEWQSGNYQHFIEESKKRFGDTYEFPDIEKLYINSHSTINFKCKKCGNVFCKKANYHLCSKNGGCKCYTAKEKKVDKETAKHKICKPSRLIPTNEIVKRLNMKYKTIEMVNPQNYKNQSEKTEFKCLECGSIFYRKANAFLYSNFVHPCPICAKSIVKQKRTKTQEQFEEEIVKRYGENHYQMMSKYISSSDKIQLKCLECGRTFEIEANSFLQGHGCPYHNCNSSIMEKELFSFIYNICNDAIQNDRTILNGHELDIFVPSKKIAFEFDGLFWHNENNKPNDYHLKKTILAKEKGIRLIHIFEDEWVYNKDILKSMITHLLGATKNVLYARNCSVREVDSSTSSDFLRKNHIQGWCPSSIKLGLFFGDDLISLMTFGKSRHFVGNGKTEWELLRFCNKIGTNVVGGASKLFKHFIKNYNPVEVVSYADMRWSVGNVYTKLGFTMTHVSKPNYYYVINNVRKNRFNFRKSILMKKYGCSKQMSERDFCFLKKWYRIYDCGCMVFKINLKKQ